MLSHQIGHDLFVGDLLTILGRLKRVPSLYPTDDVLVQVPEQLPAILRAKAYGSGSR